MRNDAGQVTFDGCHAIKMYYAPTHLAQLVKHSPSRKEHSKAMQRREITGPPRTRRSKKGCLVM